ncbi:Abi family protein [Lacticaseibacillus kribbianus]|uniref:Abi family protein n=1 Tax=Lacticaseibacillus kribbianus TaxID=2926292 RepID=UPI001CD49782|nr:Abi family protein [Lacticaseibacillus kribbianus]
MNSKPFTTHAQQIQILQSRGLKVDSNAVHALEEIGYYAVINGYKWSFLQRDSSGEVIHPEHYATGSSFNEILALYNFDADLRATLYRSLLKYESVLGAEISYKFSEAYPEANAYLAIDKYNRDPHQTGMVVGTISSLSRELQAQWRQHDEENAVKHYVNKHGHVPLWVLVNFMTFGELNYFYANLTESLQLKIAKDFTQQRTTAYHLEQYSTTPIEALLAINKIVNTFRNAVAHGEITFSRHLNKSTKMYPIKQALQRKDVILHSQAGVFELIFSLKLVLPRPDYERLVVEVTKLITTYRDQFKSVSFNAILQDMNFPQNFAQALAV